MRTLNTLLILALLPACLPTRDNPYYGMPGGPPIFAPETPLDGKADGAWQPPDTTAPDAGPPAGLTVGVATTPGGGMQRALEVYAAELTVGEMGAALPYLPEAEGVQVEGFATEPALVPLHVAKAFLNHKSQADGLEACYAPGRHGELKPIDGCRGWRLPTVTEWVELMADAGDVPRFGEVGECAPDLVERRVCYACTCPTGPRESGFSKPNRHGLRDMLGNVAEWIEVDVSRQGPFLGAFGGGDYGASLESLSSWRDLHITQHPGEVAGLRPVRSL